jgi:hypothetical protein
MDAHSRTVLTLFPMGGLANGTPSNTENFRPSWEVLKYPRILPNEVVTTGLSSWPWQTLQTNQKKITCKKFNCLAYHTLKLK